MLTTLIESRRRSSRNTGGTVASVVAHATLITLLAAVTARASDDTPATEPPPRDITYIAVPEPLPAHRDAARKRTSVDAAPRLPKPPAKRIDFPIDIPHAIPKLDLTKLTADPTDFAIADRPGSDAVGDGAPTSHGIGGAFTAWQVEKETTPLAGNPKPRYPSVLQSARIEGEVLAQFVVDTSGSVDMSTFRAIGATNELFVDAVRHALARWKFHPAEAGGRKVKQLVQMPLTFRVR